MFVQVLLLLLLALGVAEGSTFRRLELAGSAARPARSWEAEAGRR